MMSTEQKTTSATAVLESDLAKKGFIITLRKIADQPGSLSKNLVGTIIVGTSNWFPEVGKRYMVLRENGRPFSTSTITKELPNQQFATKNSVWAWEKK